MPNKEQPDVSRTYIVLKEKFDGLYGPPIPICYDAEIISEERFNSIKAHNFDKLSDWVLKNNKRVAIIECPKALIKIAPEVKVEITVNKTNYQ